MSLRTVTATRYVTPLREGGSLPAIVEADDDGMYVLKFRGAGQGPKALVAELVAGELARAVGLPVPEIVFVELDPELAIAAANGEVQKIKEPAFHLRHRSDDGHCYFAALFGLHLCGSERSAGLGLGFLRLSAETRG